jgi:hypothetical protein
MRKQNPWFFEERAFAYAALVLTERHEVAVRHYTGHDLAIDLLVEILKDGKSTLRFFGVQLVPYLDLPAIQNAGERALGHRGRDPLEAGIPLSVFVIGVRKPEGLYRWAVEPVVENGHALLQRPAEGNWQTLDEAGATRLIARVNAWYDALNGSSFPKAGGRHSKAES